MSEHHAGVRWKRTTPDFTFDGFNRSHELIYQDHSVGVHGGAGDQNKDGVDPEEQLVGALSACHMVTFLSIAAKKRLTVESYDDNAVGYLEKGSDGKFWVARVTLRPSVRFAEPMPDAETVKKIHESAHKNCFIANSVKSSVAVEPQF
jgi:organic hydroperoxide reductase OsmC/OhrA